MEAFDLSNFALLFGVGLIIVMIVNMLWPKPGAILNKKVVKVGTFNGMKKEELITKIGKPSQMANNEDGSSVLTWSAKTYAITLQFDNAVVFKRVVSERLK